MKIGSAVLASGGALDPASVRRLAEAVALARADGREVVLVSSGAVASGFRAMGLSAPPKSIVHKQAAAAIGQQRLMAAWAEAFAPHRLVVAQVLLTADDLAHRGRFLNARNTLLELLARGVVPIINENDSVSFEEIKLGDNDRLSALTAGLIGADLLLILSSVPGLLQAGGGGRVVPVVQRARDALVHVRPDKSGVGTGGMTTKLGAMATAGAWGIAGVIASGPSRA